MGIDKTEIKQKNGNSTTHNLYEIMQLLLQQYSDFANRKERLENKALGYLTPLTILMTASVAIIIMLAQNKEYSAFFYLNLLFFFGQFHFSIWTFFFALKAYSVKTSQYPNIKEYADKEWKTQKDCFLGGINNAFVEDIDELNDILERMADVVQCCRMFLIFSMVFGILNIAVFILTLLQTTMRV
jgi:hypothetical protein